MRTIKCDGLLAMVSLAKGSQILVVEWITTEFFRYDVIYLDARSRNLQDGTDGAPRVIS